MSDFYPTLISDDELDGSTDERKLNEIVDKMCLANSNEDRHHLAVQLRGAVDALPIPVHPPLKASSEISHAEERGPAVAALNKRLQALLTNSNQNHRLAAIAAFTELIHTETETIYARSQRAGNAVRRLFIAPVTDMPTAKAASAMVSALADVESPLSARAVDHVLTNAINLIGSVHRIPSESLSSHTPKKSLFSTDRARAAMVITELASVDKAPKFVLRYHERLRHALWDVVWDQEPIVREQGVRGLQAILKTVVMRAKLQVSKKAMNEVVENLRATLSPSESPHFLADELSLNQQQVNGDLSVHSFDSPSNRDHLQRTTSSSSNPAEPPAKSKFSSAPAVIHGSLCMLGSLINSPETLPYMHKLSAEICSFSLVYQDHDDALVRKAVAEILPLVVHLDRSMFTDNFLEKVYVSTMKLVQNRDIPADERGRSLISLATIWSQMGTGIHDHMLEEMLIVCKNTLQLDLDLSIISRDAVLITISRLASGCIQNPVFERIIREGLMMLMFGTNFTSLLVSSVDSVRRAVPSLDDFIRRSLVNLIAATLRKGLPDRVTGLAATSITATTSSTGNNSSGSRGHTLQRVQSSSSLQHPERVNANLSCHHRSFSDVDMESHIAAIASRTTSRDFFKQYPFSSELHRIDSSSSLTSRSSSTALDGLLGSSPPIPSPAQVPNARTQLSYHVDPLNNKHNSPCVALKAIVTYEFEGMKSQDFTSFAGEYVIGYLDSNNVKTRALAVGAAAKLMELACSVWLNTKKANGYSRRLQPEIYAILTQLVLVAVSDPSKDVRFVAIRSLEKVEFRPYLLQKEVLGALFMSFHDESLGMRDSALSLVGRLGDSNPAYVLPTLRSYLNHLFTVLRFDGPHFSRARREATELINTLVHSAPYFVEPYTRVLIDALLLRLEDAHVAHDTDSALPVLLTIAEMGGTISRLNLKPYRDSLIPLVVSSVLEVQGVSVLFRKAALRALGALAKNTGFVIKPYVEHPTLLPRLLELLRVETDRDVRIEIEALLGSLGAVDPGNHKYAALPILSFSGQFPHLGRGTMGDGQSKSLVRAGSHVSRIGAHWGGSGSRLRGSGSNCNAKPSSSATNRQRGSYGSRMSPDREGSHSGSDRRNCSVNPSSKVSSKSDEVHPCISWFSLGGAHLAKRIQGYIPEWARDEVEYVSFVGQLDHPFTSSQDYFSAVLLDELHKLISTRRPRFHLREACQAIVNILVAIGPRCTYFLPEVVPRMMWLVEQLSSMDTARPALGANMRQHAIRTLCDIVSIASREFIQYAFDAILLAWNYLLHSKNSPSTTIAFCELLTSIRQALGDDFKHVIPTVLPQLLAILTEDKSFQGKVASAVLSTLESFCPLLDEFSNMLFSTLAKVVSMERPYAARKEALISLIRIVHNMESVDILLDVVHPLVQILAGAFNFSGVDAVRPQKSSAGSSRNEAIDKFDMETLAAIALLEIGMRAPRSFTAFVKVITKALQHSRVQDTNLDVFRSLLNFLASQSSNVLPELNEENPDFGSAHRFANHGPALPFELPKELMRTRAGNRKIEHHLEGLANRVYVDQKILTQKWEVESHFKEEDWVKWLSSLGATMFQQSGCNSFRACVRISESYPIFTKNLFNPAFLSCWTAPLSDETKAKICYSLDVAISSPSVPLNVLQALLNLFEFMEHDEKPLPLDPDKLASMASRCGALAKAIRYWEKEYSQNLVKNDRPLEEINGGSGLIAIYDKLGHTESAFGTIYHYQNKTGALVQEQWYEKLQKWDDAYAVYEKVHAISNTGDKTDLFSNERKWESTLGILRCFNNMGEWRRMVTLLHDVRSTCTDNHEAMRQLAQEGKALSVTFDLGLWEEFEEWLQFIRPDSYDGCFYKTLLLLKQGKEDPPQLFEARGMIRKAQQYLDLELTALVSEGYPRAYSHVVRAQTLVELEEMTDFLEMAEEESQSYGKVRLQEVWNKRLMGCKRDRFTWYRVLMTRALVLKPIESKDQWLEYATMCRKAKLLPLANEALQLLVTSYAETKVDSDLHRMLTSGATSHVNGGCQQNFDLRDDSLLMSISDLELRFACIKHIWAMNMHSDAYRALETCRLEYLADAGIAIVDSSVVPYSGVHSNEKKLTLAGEVFSKLSKWGHRLRDSGEVKPANITDPLDYAKVATEIRPDWYKAWHYWAMMNSSRFEELMQRGDGGIGQEEAKRTLGTGHRIGLVEKNFLTYSLRGYFRAIHLCGKSRLEDSLKLLTLWFRYGRFANMHHEFNNGFRISNVDRWLEVVPQIIARLHTPYSVIQKGVKLLLTRIGMAHPHVAVYPLTVAKSTGGSQQGKRSRAATEILEELKTQHKDIVEQAEMVARELVRVAVLWPEQWFEKLEEASKMYFNEHDVEGMIDTLLPLHVEIEQTAETEAERKFVSEFGRDLYEAGQLCRRYRARRSNGADEAELHDYIDKVWRLYSAIFYHIQRHQQGTQDLNLSIVSNGLDKASGLVLAVPGTYIPDDSVPVVGIESFSPLLQVIQSKQRPRKLSIMGSNGHEYQFLLKGHEDLRQDERVMQVFGLINKLFAKSEQRSLLNGVGMTMYSVIALSANAGLIEWVPNYDTMHALVKNYREQRNIMPNIEQWVMVQLAPAPERLSLLQKADLFEFMLQSTGGADLSRVLWLKSRNSEMWLDRRTTYAKSLATTSMTGYLLGLGDRHPSNVMIERSTGKIMHIDFGDCFEVAMKREKYPERIPFRLTRMLVDVLEPCGVDGFFRHTAVATMEVLRQHAVKEALMSMMEAFVYDPLIRWKLIGAEELTQLKREEDEAAAQGRRGRPPPDYSEPNEHIYQHEQNGRGLSARGDDRIEESSPPLMGLGRDVARDIDDIVRSLKETGSLTATFRLRDAEMERSRLAAPSDNAEPGAIATPQAGGMNTPSTQARGAASDIDMMVTPSYAERMQQARIMGDGHGSHEMIAHVSNQRAQLALDRFADKLSGTDFDVDHVLSVNEQVDLLIRDARNVENLCTLFLGWCAFW